MFRFGAKPVELHALHQLRGGVGQLYESLGEDPQFDLRTPKGIGRTVAPGWYLMTARFGVLEGEIVSPCLYPDYGDGMAEATRIDLPEPDDDGIVRAVVLINRRLRMLRLDPTVLRARFELSVTFSRISRPRVLVEMLRGIRRANGAHAWPVLKAFLRQAAMGRVSAAADKLHQRYLGSHRQSHRGYQQWTSLFGNLASGTREPVTTPPRRPRISILLPVHDAPLPALRACLDSVLAQTYPDWQLCIVDDVSRSEAVRALLRQYAERDPRIALHLRKEHGHICRSSNDALAMADGDFVGFLDHDDALAPDALLEVARAIGEHPGARLLYSDEDKIDEDGSRYDPHFKPAWNPDLLRAYNYICHFTVIERALVMEAGGLRPGFEGAQDHDLALRCTERLPREAIVHIPKVLYHWRAVAGSTALGVDQKSYALLSGQRAVEEHMERIGRPSRVEITPAGNYRVLRGTAASLPPVTIIIPTRDRVELLRACIDSIVARTDYPEYDILVVDNGSMEPQTLEYFAHLKTQARTTVLDYSAPFNYSAIMNHASRHATGEMLCMLNNDVEVISPDWLCELVTHARRPEVGVVGGMLYYPDDTIQHAGVILGIGGVAGHAHGRLRRGSRGYVGRANVTHNLTAITGACMVLRRSVYEEVGGMDESLPVAFNDIDFCMRVHQRGYDNVWTPHAELYHHESASRGLEDTPEKRARFDLECDRMKRKWGDVLRNDPAYNPNLSLENGQFDLAFPPRELRPRRAGFPDISIQAANL